MNENNSTPRLIQNRFQLFNRHLQEQRAQLQAHLLDVRSSQELEEFKLSSVAALERPKVFSRISDGCSYLSSPRVFTQSQMQGMRNQSQTHGDACNLQENSIFTNEQPSIYQ